MSLLAQPAAPIWHSNPSITRQMPRYAADIALAFFSQHPAAQWRGRHAFTGGEIIFPDPARACDLAKEAAALADAGRDHARAITLADDALRLDFTGPVAVRGKVYLAASNDAPYRASVLYVIGLVLYGRKLWQEACAAYQASAQIDPLLCWHLNDFAWMAATAPDPQAHAGLLAVKLAEHACAISGWGHWSFLGTLAAAFARSGDFDRAMAWQRIAVQLAASDEREVETARLRSFEAGEPLVEHKDPAKGNDLGGLAKLDARQLLFTARELIGLVAPPIH